MPFCLPSLTLPRAILASVVVALVSVASVTPAAATTSIYYSAKENAYGWCAGYAHRRARACAKRYCGEAGGTDCRRAVECPGGWGAIALARKPATGFGSVCGMGDASSARRMALVTCMAASNGLCSTDVAFSRNGRTVRNSSNAEFGGIWLVQGLLNIRGMKAGTADGRMGPSTREAIRRFQGLIGLPETGEIENGLFRRLVDSVGGMKKYVDYVRRDVLEPNRSIVDEQAYANAPSAMIERTFTEELKIRPEESRLTGIATMLASAGIACTVPARSAEWKSDEVWRVDCGEKSYEIDFATGEGKTLFRFPGTKE